MSFTVLTDYERLMYIFIDSLFYIYAGAVSVMKTGCLQQQWLSTIVRQRYSQQRVWRLSTIDTRSEVRAEWQLVVREVKISIERDGERISPVDARITDEDLVACVGWVEKRDCVRFGVGVVDEVVGVCFETCSIEWLE